MGKQLIGIISLIVVTEIKLIRLYLAGKPNELFTDWSYLFFLGVLLKYTYPIESRHRWLIAAKENIWIIITFFLGSLTLKFLIPQGFDNQMFRFLSEPVLWWALIWLV